MSQIKPPGPDAPKMVRRPPPNVPEPPSPFPPRVDARVGRRRFVLFGAAVVGLAGCATVRVSSPQRDCNLPVPFPDEQNLGALPGCWQPQVMRHDLPITRYEVVERDGRTALHSVADGATSGLRCDVDVDPNETPWLHWSWRVDHVDLRSTVAADELDDSPTRVIVAFDGDNTLLNPRDRLFHEMVEAVTGYAAPFATLMYVWDGKAPVESVFRYPRTSRIRYLVVESGAERTGQWLRYSRNVVDDYRRVFEAEPGRIRALAVLTDSDDLKTHSEAWYADVAFSRAPG